jgi:uncharacterized protein (TIGR02594 family)
VVKNADGSISTVRSMSANFDGKEVLIPTVSNDGKILTNDQAIDQYKKTGQNLGVFDTPEHADAYAKQLHDAQAKFYGQQETPTASDSGQAGGMPANTPPREYGDLNLPLTIPGMMKAPAFDRLQKSGIYEQLPKDLQEKIKAGAEGDGPLTLTKADLDSIPAAPWKTMAKEFGLPEPKEAAAPAQKQQTQNDVPGLAPPPAAKASASTATPVEIAKRFEGLNERDDRGTIAAFIEKSAGKRVDPAKTAWCAAFVNAVLGESGREGTGSLMAKSFLQYGSETKQPSEGDIVVLSRGDPNGPYGHVGFYVGRDDNGNVKVLAGNQGNAVSVRSFSEDQVLGFRRPPEAGTATNIPGAAQPEGVPQYNPRYSELTPMQRMTLQKRAEQSLASKQGAETQQASDLVNDDLASMRQTGQGVAQITPEQVSGTLGPRVAQEWQAKREFAWNAWNATTGMPAMTGDQLDQHIRSLEPQPGEGFTKQAAIYGEAKKEYDRIVKQRANDPAEAVSSDPQVRMAAKAVDPNNPDTMRALGAARVAAQGRLGIDAAPITVKEAGKYSGMLDQAANDPRRTKDLADATVDQIVKDWGEQLAPSVFATVMQRYKVDKDSAAAMYSILHKRGLDAPVTPEDYDNLRNNLDLNARSRAMDWGSNEPKPGWATPSQGESPARQKTAQASQVSPQAEARTSATRAQPQGDFAPGKTYIVPEDIGRLRLKEWTPEQFDQKYGRGAAMAVVKARGL